MQVVVFEVLCPEAGKFQSAGESPGHVRVRVPDPCSRWGWRDAVISILPAKAQTHSLLGLFQAQIVPF